jgi:uncharacterized protein YuzE
LDRDGVPEEKTAMSVTIGPYTFPVVHYDAGGDVLYLHTVAPDGAVDFDATPEGHALRFGPDGEIVGITIVDARWLLQRDGHIRITLPAPQSIDVDADALGPVLLAA